MEEPLWRSLPLTATTLQLCQQAVCGAFTGSRLYQVLRPTRLCTLQ